MKTRLHLISTPWLIPTVPSIQLGCLKAYVDQAFKGEIKTFSYSAHFQIPLAVEGEYWEEFYKKMQKMGEYPYLLLIHQRFPKNRRAALTDSECARALKTLNRSDLGSVDPITFEDLRLLENCTNRYIDEYLIPNLSTEGVNVIGFSLNFDQTYSSLYIEKYLREKRPDLNLFFLYGGYRAGDPIGLEMLIRMGATGYSVLGEGERKLELILQQLVNSAETSSHAIVMNIDGVVLPANGLRSFDRAASFLGSQISKLENLPLPEYDEFFQAYDAALIRHPFLKLTVRRGVSLEGTRGCFSHCDFCALNSQWEGFRKMSAERIYGRVMELTKKYHCEAVLFLDNVCDTWAERYAELMMNSERRVDCFMELRAHHKEEFWVKLVLGGLERVQIGVEALSQPLLSKIGKGTKIIQNLVATKCFTELGIVQGNNLISHHPKSTLEDISETKRIIMATPHLPSYSIAKFRLQADSPVFDGLKPADRKRVKFKSIISLGGKLRDEVGQGFLELPSPVALKPQVKKKWDEFKEWYARETAAWERQNPTMTVKRLKDGRLQIEDKRGVKKKIFYLKGDEVTIHDAGHAGPSLGKLVALTGLPEKEF